MVGRRLRLPSVLAVAVLATSCGKDDCGKTKSCELATGDASQSSADAGPPPVCPTDIPSSQPCPPGCEDVPTFC